MLDSDASFFLVPEFQSSRGARRSRSAPSQDFPFGPAPGTDLCLAPVPDPGTRGAAAIAAFDLSPASFMPSEARIAAEPSHPAGICVPRVEPDAADAPTPAGESPAEFTMLSPADSDFLQPDGTPPASDSRAITPRRPMRFTFARDTAEPGRITLPVQNLFDGVFDSDSLDGPDVDPRLQRSRARARARLAAHEATLPPEARNLWCDDGSETETAETPVVQAAETAAGTAPETVSPRRAVRHLTVTRRTPRPRLDAAAIHDPLQDHLHHVRDALYAPLPEAEVTAAPPQAAPLAARLPVLTPFLIASLTLFVTLLQGLITLRNALTRASSEQDSHARTCPAPRRAQSLTGYIRTALTGPLRMPARAAAITALVLVLAQTVPRDLM